MKNALYASLHPCYQNGSYICDCGNASQTIDEHRQHLFQSRQCLKNNATIGDKHWVVEQEVLNFIKTGTCLINFNDERQWVGVIFESKKPPVQYFEADIRQDGTFFMGYWTQADWTPTIRKAKEILQSNFRGSRWKRVMANACLAADQNPPREHSAVNINSVGAAAFGCCKASVRVLPDSGIKYF